MNFRVIAVMPLLVLAFAGVADKVTMKLDLEIARRNSELAGAFAGAGGAGATSRLPRAAEFRCGDYYDAFYPDFPITTKN